MRIPSFRQSACIYTIAVSIGLVFTLSEANFAFADESLDQLLTTAMENHPDIVTAKAKVALAEAELNATRLQVARQIIALWGNRQSQFIAIEQNQQQLSETKDKVEREIHIHNIQNARTKLEQTETEMKFLTVKAAPVVLQNISSNAPTAPPKEPQYPGGPIVEGLAKEFRTKTIDLNFIDAPLKDVKDYLADYLNYPVYLDKNALGDAGISPDTPVTIRMDKAPLPAVLQALQDQNQGWMFVIRDYGILLTTIDQANAQGYYSALEFAKSLEKEKSPGAATPETKPLKPVQK